MGVGVAWLGSLRFRHLLTALPPLMLSFSFPLSSPHTAAETSHSCLYAAGDATSPPGVVALHFAKFNLNGAPWGAAVVDGHKGLVSLMGMGGAYSGLNVTVAGGADTHVLMAGNALWVNTSSLSISGAAEVSVFADICVATCLPSQHYFPQRMYADTLNDATSAMDAIRRLGALDVALNYPWAVSSE